MTSRSALALLLIAIAFAAPASASDREAKPAKKSPLANASSRYLRTHAANPVQWHSWGNEAFDAAKKAQKKGSSGQSSWSRVALYWSYQNLTSPAAIPSRSV